METLSSLLEARLHAVLAGFGGGEARVQPVADARFGDYQTNAALLLAKQQKMNPRQLAQQIAEKLEVADLCEPPEIAGPGFINFRLKPSWLAERFVSFVGDPRLGVPLPERRKKLVIDFSSPNVAKPMHVGHIRSTILGDAVSRIAEFVGHKVVRDNHIGDWGTQFGMLLVGWKTELHRAALEADPLGEMERLYKRISPQCDEKKPEFNAATRDRARQELVKLQGGDEENLAIWKEMIRLSQRQFDEIYGRLGVRFDVALGESFYNSRLKGVVEELRAKGIARESEGASCVFSDEAGPREQDPFFIKDADGWRPNPALVQKADGAANYTTTDLATLQHRVSEWNPDEIVYVTDGRQQLHFRQLFAIFRRWRPEDAVKLVHAWFGAILGDDGKPFKTRSGDTVKLADLLTEAEERAYALVTEKNPALSEEERREIGRVIGLGAVKYADLLPNRQSDYVFSWDKMLSFQGNTAPYLQYSYVRIQAIFRKAEANAAESGVGQKPSKEELMETIHDAVLSAARETVGPARDLRVAANEHTGEMCAIARFTVVDSVKNEHMEISLEAARKIAASAQIGDELDVPGTTKEFGRSAAKRAKGALMQQIRQAEGMPSPEGATGDGQDVSPPKVAFSEPAELTLVKKLYQFGEVLPTVLDDYRPNLLCNYLYELASAFHSFFEACPVLRAETELARTSRLVLCQSTSQVLEKGLDLLGISVPNRM